MAFVQVFVFAFSFLQGRVTDFLQCSYKGTGCGTDMLMIHLVAVISRVLQWRIYLLDFIIITYLSL